MAWENLPTDYANRNWTGLQKYNIITNEDNTVSFDDVTEYEDEEDSFFGAADANQMNAAMNFFAQHWMSSYVTVTIAASGWVEDTETGTTSYSFEEQYPSTQYDILDIIPYNGTTTAAMRRAWNNAGCNGYSDTNTITAYGIVPTIDIVMKLILKEKL